MPIISSILYNISLLTSSISIGYFSFKYFNYKFLVRQKIQKGSLSKYFPNIEKTMKITPNNLTSIRFSLVKGKINYGLVNKETIYIDINDKNSSLFKEYTQNQKEIEENSFLFKILVYFEKSNKKIKILNFDSSIKSLMIPYQEKYFLSLSEENILEIILYLTRLNLDYILYNSQSPFFIVNFSMYSVNKPQSSLFPIHSKEIKAYLSVIEIEQGFNRKIHIKSLENQIFYDKISPIIVFYIVKSRIDTKLECIIDVIGNNISKTLPFIVIIMKLIRENPYMTMTYKTVESVNILNWIEKSSLLEVFYLNDLSSIESIEEIVIDNSGNISNKVLENFYIKNELVELVRLIYEGKIVSEDLILNEYYC